MLTEVLAFGDEFQRHRFAVGGGNLDQGPQAVLGFGGNPHLDLRSTQILLELRIIPGFSLVWSIPCVNPELKAR